MSAEELVDEFLGKYEYADFPHARVVIELLRDRAQRMPGLSVISGRLTQATRDGYRYRASMASRHPTPGSPALGADATALAVALDAAADQPMRIWSLLLEGGRLYMMFELVTDEAIAGCLETKDARFANPSIDSKP